MATLRREISFASFDQTLDAPALPQEVMPQEFVATPSLPAILVHVALGLSSAGLALTITHWGMGYDWLISTVIALWALVVLFGPLGLLCSRLAGSSALLRNLGYGCALTVVTLLCFGLCGLVGGLAAVVAQAITLK